MMRGEGDRGRRSRRAWSEYPYSRLRLISFIYLIRLNKTIDLLPENNLLIKSEIVLSTTSDEKKA